MAGQNDLAKLFKRVSALEQGENEDEQDVARILKHYASIGVTFKVRFKLKQHLISGDTNPLALAVTSSTTLI
jgi:hypothetical protein